MVSSVGSRQLLCMSRTFLLHVMKKCQLSIFRSCEFLRRPELGFSEFGGTLKENGDRIQKGFQKCLGKEKDRDFYLRIVDKFATRGDSFNRFGGKGKENAATNVRTTFHDIMSFTDEVIHKFIDKD